MRKILNYIAAYLIFLFLPLFSIQIAVYAQEPIDMVQQDLAQRLGIAPTDINLLMIEEVVWPDTCLGLPASNEPCVSKETPGYKITLLGSGKAYRYHTDRGEIFKFAGPIDNPLP